MKAVDNNQILTPYGTVNAKTLRTLQDSFDTSAMLRMVDPVSYTHLTLPTTPYV